MLPFKDRASFPPRQQDEWDEGYNDAIHGVEFQDKYATDAYASGYDAGLYDLRGDK